MPAYWITFEDEEEHPDGCIKAKDWQTAEQLAKNIAPIHKMLWLPYPAHPIVDDDWTDGCPAFCHQPQVCKGKTACPYDPACSE